MRPQWVVYADNGRILSRPWYLGETIALSPSQAASQVRHRLYPHRKTSDLGFQIIAFIKGSQDELNMRAKAEKVPKTFKDLPIIPSSLT